MADYIKAGYELLMTALLDCNFLCLIHQSMKIPAPPNLDNAGTLVGTKANVRHSIVLRFVGLG